MLSRTADCLYWMARYSERAENTARMLDVSYQTSLLPQPNEFLEENWRNLLNISHLEKLFNSRYETINRENIFDFMISDFGNPASIVSCLKAARENARAIRGKISSEVWETQNTTWLEVNTLLNEQKLGDPSLFSEWVKDRSHLFHGVVEGTMLKNESYYFMSIGKFLERADNTARILEIKYDIASQTQKKSETIQSKNIDDDFFEFYHWASILKSVSAFEIYRQTYSDHISPQKIADLLIFNSQMPRSLMYCINTILNLMPEIKNSNSKNIEKLIGKLKSDLEYSDIDEIFNQGLDKFLKVFLEKINRIADQFSNTYLIPLAVA